MEISHDLRPFDNKPNQPVNCGLGKSIDWFLYEKTTDHKKLKKIVLLYHCEFSLNSQRKLL